ncbi:molybdopterin dehydrogenase, FAD-binding protein [Candidatus Koribacter versatilis Ellin345]|uniref:Molybdopterin dehydrogenase, FAD-binding protein n=1 Tax=Koribacter versatilis (strain Ellin345) TaxID=204669 RepID=Q1ITN2_KORVE|nr:FAD binding domain-containing protein [Candidatus Koribacter versatilis]ABF39768.1 molybdopterin dehydrogenase, FAD-binding protein [Candidatus Koribacter versatilis Ellin345]
MRPFEYVNANSRNQVGELLGKNWGDAEILAGGTDLVALMKDEVVNPKRLVNIKGIDDLHGLKADASGMRIGALVTLSELAHGAELAKVYPAIADAARDAASPQIRNVATIGGNICQRPRCWYFRNGMGLLPTTKDGKSMVLAGDHRYHAVLGNDGPAYFVSPSTVVPALIAHGAKVRILGGGKLREVELEKFFITPKNENEREHDLRPNELVVEIFIPAAAGVKAANYEVRQKEHFDWPLATCSVALTMDGSKVKSAKIVLGAVAPVPWVSNEAAQAIVGKEITPDTAMAAANAALAPAKSLGQNKYKITMAKAAVKRALLAAAGGQSAHLGGHHDAHA